MKFFIVRSNEMHTREEEEEKSKQFFLIKLKV